MITHEESLDHFHQQIRYVLNAWTRHGLKISDYKNVVIGGLGGSGIGGRISKSVFFSSFPAPIEIISEYSLPAYVGSESLVILSSYSGNTEESLALFEEAKLRGSKIIAISGGGFLLKLSQTQNIPCYIVENGYQPRMALGYSLSYLLLILGELMGRNMVGELNEIAGQLENNSAHKSLAMDIFNTIKSTTNDKIVVVCDMGFEAVAVRFCQQIQENAKGEAFISVLPEANHNMIESYYGKQSTNFIFLYSGLNEKVGKRFNFVKEILNQTNTVSYTFAVEPFSISRIFEVIHILDWVSIYLSNAKGVNNMEVPNIARLKSFLEEKKG